MICADPASTTSMRWSVEGLVFLDMWGSGLGRFRDLNLRGVQGSCLGPATCSRSVMNKLTSANCREQLQIPSTVCLQVC